MIKSDDCIAQFQNEHYEILKSTFYSPRMRSNQERFQLQYEYDYEIGTIENFGENGFRGVIKFDTKAYPKEEGEDAIIVDVSMFGIFNGSGENMQRENFEQLLELNGLTFLTQIMRAHIITVTSITGSNPLIMPMINVNKLIESKKRDN